ncbi:hypothetical protein [Amycolatopsis sp. lyj-346]|uniref:hypothetical protein n=1 Tax=Amycolatopsis sp. lyj-346 TaxID=2789289 RepID=UPI003978A8A1
MNSQITPEQAEILLTLYSLILVAVVTRLVALVAWRKWFRDAAPDNLTQEERDLRRVQRRGRR